MKVWWIAPMIAVLASGTACVERQVAAKKEEKKASPARDPMEIIVTAELARQIKVGEPSWSQVAGTLRVAATVEADETRVARVSAPVTGRITDLEVIEGQNVRRGEALGTIHSTQLSDEQSNLLKAVSQRRLAERAVERARRLLEAGVIGEAELQRREAELQQATTELTSTRDQLKILGMSEEVLQKVESTRTVNSTAQVLATIDGTVLERKVTIGQVVQSAEVVCVLADLSRVWLVADVPEQAAGAIEVGKQVLAEILSLPGQTMRGRLSFVSSTVDRETRTVRIRMEVPNPKRKLKPAMLATMLLSDAAENHRIVPLTAIVREGNQDYVFVQTAGQSFRLKQVNLGLEHDGRRVILDGVGTGEKVVLEGAFHLNNERKRLALQGNG